MKFVFLYYLQVIQVCGNVDDKNMMNIMKFVDDLSDLIR